MITTHICKVTGCAPADGGPLTLDRLAAGWLVSLDCGATLNRETRAELGAELEHKHGRTKRNQFDVGPFGSDRIGLSPVQNLSVTEALELAGWLILTAHTVAGEKLEELAGTVDLVKTIALVGWAADAEQPPERCPVCGSAALEPALSEIDGLWTWDCAEGCNP